MLSARQCDIHNQLPALLQARCVAGLVRAHPMSAGTLQFCVVKPLMTAAIVAMNLAGVYDDGSLSLSSGARLWCMHARDRRRVLLCHHGVQRVVHRGAVCALPVLRGAFRSPQVRPAPSHLISCRRARPYKPVGKFIVVKSVIFLSFWQGVFIAALVHFGYIQGTLDQVCCAAHAPHVSPFQSVTAGQLAVTYQNFIVCAEMFVAALAHQLVFSYSSYKTIGSGSETSSSDIATNLKEVRASSACCASRG